MAKSAAAAAAGRKRKSTTSVSDLEITDAANLLMQLIQLSGSSDTIYYDAEEESVGKTTPTAHPVDHDQVSSNSAFKYSVFEEEEEDEDEVGFGKRIEKKRFRLISDLYERTKPLKNGGVVNRRKRMMV